MTQVLGHQAALHGVDDCHCTRSDVCASYFPPNTGLNRHHGRLRGTVVISGKGKCRDLLDIQPLIDEKGTKATGIANCLEDQVDRQRHRTQPCRTHLAAQSFDLRVDQFVGR